MNKILLSFILLTGLLISGCGQSVGVDCEQLDVKECTKYAKQCIVCPDSIVSTTNSCHEIIFCNNFTDLNEKNP